VFYFFCVLRGLCCATVRILCLLLMFLGAPSAVS